jgi:hypothetical protein
MGFLVEPERRNRPRRLRAQKSCHFVSISGRLNVELDACLGSEKRRCPGNGEGHGRREGSRLKEQVIDTDDQSRARTSLTAGTHGEAEDNRISKNESYGDQREDLGARKMIG